MVVNRELERVARGIEVVDRPVEQNVVVRPAGCSTDWQRAM
jgi:hypothetical protein